MSRIRYILDENKNAVATSDFEEYSAFMADFKKNVRVGRTVVDIGLEVSTVFLGTDHRWGDGPPLLFETMVFNGDTAQEHMWRYETWEQAERGHEKVVLDASKGVYDVNSEDYVG